MKKLRIVVVLTGLIIGAASLNVMAQARAEKTSSAKAYYGSKPEKSKLTTPKTQKRHVRPNKRKNNSSARLVRKRYA